PSRRIGEFGDYRETATRVATILSARKLTTREESVDRPSQGKRAETIVGQRNDRVPPARRRRTTRGCPNHDAQPLPFARPATPHPRTRRLRPHAVRLSAGEHAGGGGTAAGAVPVGLRAGAGRRPAVHP